MTEQGKQGNTFPDASLLAVKPIRNLSGRGVEFFQA